MNVAKIYYLATKLHALIPYYFSTEAYAFAPWHYYFEITRRCNLRCHMCQYIEWLKATPVSEQGADELSTEEWLGVIGQVQRRSVATFTGGEPFLRKDFMHLLEYASSRCRTHFISNGVLLTDDLAERCVALSPRKLGGVGLNFVGISIDGPQEIHDRIRGVKGGFEKSTNAIKALVQFRRRTRKKCPLVHVTSVIQNDTLDVLHEMPRIVADAGGDVLNLTMEIRTLELEGLGEVDPCGYDISEITFPSVDADRLAKALADTRAAAKEAGIELRTPDMPDAEIVRYYQGEMDLDKFHCDAIWSTVFVASKGDVYPCWLRKVGNVRERSLRAIWNNPEIRHFRQCARSGLPAPCVGCCFLAHGGRKSKQRAS